MRALHPALFTITNALLPSQCLLCASALKNNLLCPDCHYDLVYTRHACQQCGLLIDDLNTFCGHCLSHPPAFDKSFIPFAYDYPLDNLIHKFKYRRHLTSGKLLGQLLADFLVHHAQDQYDWTGPDLIIPTPMHWLRRWQRGFNQAEILGHYAAQALNIPLATKLIKRTHRTLPQKGLSRHERQKNLRKAFAISDQDKEKIQDKRIALIDDVVTTTATMRELSQLLMKAGAKSVQVWALARTM